MPRTRAADQMFDGVIYNGSQLFFHYMKFKEHTYSCLGSHLLSKFILLNRV